MLTRYVENEIKECGGPTRCRERMGFPVMYINGLAFLSSVVSYSLVHDDVIKWKHFPRYWPLVRGIHRSTVVSPHKGLRRRDLMCSLTCGWTNSWANNRDAGDLRRHRAHYDVTLMCHQQTTQSDMNIRIKEMTIMLLLGAIKQT